MWSGCCEVTYMCNRRVTGVKKVWKVKRRHYIKVIYRQLIQYNLVPWAALFKIYFFDLCWEPVNHFLTILACNISCRHLFEPNNGKILQPKHETLCLLYINCIINLCSDNVWFFWHICFILIYAFFLSIYHFSNS